MRKNPALLVIALFFFIQACILSNVPSQMTRQTTAPGQVNSQPPGNKPTVPVPSNPSPDLTTATAVSLEATSTPVFPPDLSALSPSSVPATPIPKAEISATITAIPRVGSTRIADTDGMTLVYVPAGKFLMGSSEAQYQAAVAHCVNEGYNQGICQKQFELEKPAHSVYLDAFWLDQTEVTNGLYAKCVSAGACQLSMCNESANLNGERQPVLCVDWSQAKTYCTWAGRRLPTEAEWEKAARGTDGRQYPWGSVLDPQKANYDLRTGQTQDVGSYPAGASPYGALDMAGNVSEWVADWLGMYSAAAQHNPQGPESGYERVLRGGSWGDNWWGIRTAFRLGDYDSEKDQSKGFRCALSAAP